MNVNFFLKVQSNDEASVSVFVKQHAVMILENVNEKPIKDLVKMLTVATDTSLFASFLNTCAQRCGPLFTVRYFSFSIKLFVFMTNEW